ncbi:MAG: hypothetical protein NZ480_01825, partial [Bdellovibrionaceae bacterium]|nr:hypothetical protein [Pseudobdellovibrionaceae bacterium]
LKSIQGLAELGSSVIHSKNAKEIAVIQSLNHQYWDDQTLNEILNLLEPFLTSSPSVIASFKSELLQQIDKLQFYKILYGPQVRRFHEALVNAGNAHNPENLAKLEKESRLLVEAIKQFGQFNAYKDPNLFLRDGIVNFEALVMLWDLVANFYSQRTLHSNARQAFHKFLTHCSKNSFGKGWIQIIQQTPECPQLLRESFLLFVNSQVTSPRSQDSIGRFLPALVTTSIIDDINWVKKIILKKNQYQNQLMESSWAWDLVIPSEVLKFGYWGRKVDLARIQQFFNAYPDHELSRLDKSRRFHALSPTIWRVPLTYSPAEPGLSAFLPIPSSKERSPQKTELSFGGWSDLAPVPVLKALGCPKVVLITRKGGESFFAQGVAKRLLGFPGIPWDDLNPDPSDSNEAIAINHRGRPVTDDPQWSAMFNMADPNSSIKVSLKYADAIVCTSWNQFNVTKDFREMLWDAYNAPVFFRSEWLHQKNQMKLFKNPKVITYQDNQIVERTSSTTKEPLPGQWYPKYSGCIP